jgi:hypothetical protein
VSRFKITIPPAVTLMAAFMVALPAFASIGDDLESATALEGRISEQLGGPAYCQATDLSAVTALASEVEGLGVQVAKWQEKKGSSGKWAAPISEAQAALRRSAKLVADAQQDFDACLDWVDVAAAWNSAEDMQSVASLADKTGRRTGRPGYKLARNGPLAADKCSRVFGAYLSNSDAAVPQGPVADPAAELVRIKAVTPCADPRFKAPSEARAALIRADMEIQASLASTDPVEISKRINTALNGYTPEVESTRAALIDSAVGHLRTTVDAALATAAKAPPSPESIRDLGRLQAAMAKVPHPTAAALGGQIEVQKTKAEREWDRLETIAASAPGIKYDPSAKVVEAAIAFGKANRTASLDSFRREWLRRVGVSQDTVEFMVATPFFNVAANSLSAARSYNELTAAAATRYADEFRNKFAFLASFLVASPSEARDYKVVVKVGDTVVRPVKEDRDSCSRVDAGLLCSITGYFPIDKVPPDAKVTLVLVRGSFGREVTASFDLTKLR